MKNNHAFTLVELIVVVTILAILSTIGFVSYSGYLTGVRDTNRISSLTAISDGLELYRTKNDLPLPDDSVEVKVNGVTIARQGYVGKNVLQTIEYSKSGKDPKDDSYYSYYLTDDNKHYQLMAFLEESDQLEVNTVFQANAVTNYSSRYPKVYGKRLGILTDTYNTPIQEVASIVSDGELNFTGGTSTEYIARFLDDENLTGSGEMMMGVAQNSSCKRIKDFTKKSKSGFYTIDPQQNGTGFQVYCDMQTNGGGWTRVHLLAYNAVTQRSDYQVLFTENNDFSGSGYTTNITPIYYNDFIYMVADEKTEVEEILESHVRTVGTKGEALGQWIQAYGMNQSDPFLRDIWYFYTDIAKTNKYSIDISGKHSSSSTVTGFRNMQSELLLSGNNGLFGSRNTTNMPFGKRGLSTPWCPGGIINCATDTSNNIWASLWIR